MRGEECIYNLIPKVFVEPEKPERHRSKFNPKTQPTASTFGVTGKTRLPGSNVGNNAQTISTLQCHKDLGKPKTTVDPKSFTKKGSGCATLVNPSSKPKKFTYPDKQRKVAVVKRYDAPILGLKSSKNFVTSNAVETILAVPGGRAKAENTEIRYTEKEDYGQVPQYLSQVKAEINRENEMIEEFVRQNRNIVDEDDAHRVEPMDDTEREQLVNSLKAKWDHVNAKYQKTCHNVVFDTLGKVRRKETYEKELAQLEKDIELLTKGPVGISHH